MKEYHLHPDGHFIIRENGAVSVLLQAHEIAQFCEISLPEGCTEILVGTDGIIYATKNKAMEGISENPLATLIGMEDQIRVFCTARDAAQAHRLIEQDQ
jgi:hypothetical protein